MKNLKRALSLVLSTAMVLGMMVVGTGAAFADVKAAHNEEAIAVAEAAGIFAGDENGNFNPDKNITRNEMAVVMVNMLDLDVADFDGAAGFVDVPAWAAPYVDACYANGIVSGISATEFGGNDNVTTAQAALMMLKALGYFEAKGFDNWLLDTIKQASKIDLLDGINAKATAALTRNEVAQLVLNTLEATMVEEFANGSNTSIKGENLEITIDSGVTTEIVKNSKTSYNGKDDGEMQLIENLFGEKFVKGPAKTDLGMPAMKWENTKTEKDIIVIAEEADDVVIATKEIAVAKLYEDEVDDDFDGKITEATAKAGDVVYFYENGENVDAYIVSYELAEITKIDDDMKKSEVKDGHKFEVSLEINGKTEKIYDDNFAGFDYEKGDYVLVVLNDEKDEVLLSELAEIVEGKIKAVNSKGKLNIGGTYYTNNSGEELGLKDEVTVALNKAGQIIALVDLEEAVKSTDFAYIYNTGKATTEGETNEDGVDAADETDILVYVVLADGSKAKYVLEEDSTVAKGDVVAYSINKDDEFVVENSDLTAKAVKATLSADDKYVTIDGAKVYANSKTEFVFASWNEKGTKLTATTATGIKNVDINNEDMVVVYDADDKEALVVFVMAEVEEPASEADYAILISEAFVKTIDDDDNVYYTYDVWADGEEIEMSFEKEIEVKADEVFAYFYDDGYAVVSKADYALESGKVTYVGEDFYEVDGVEYTVADDCEFVTITKVYDADEEYDYTDIDDSGKLTKDAEILFSADDDVITLAFILAEDK